MTGGISRRWSRRRKSTGRKGKRQGRTFDDMAVPTGIGDNDGNLDLLPCNGHPDDKIEERYSQVKYKEPLLLP